LDAYEEKMEATQAQKSSAVDLGMDLEAMFLRMCEKIYEFDNAAQFVAANREFMLGIIKRERMTPKVIRISPVFPLNLFRVVQ
jgi:hypothetical protein